MLPQRLKRWPNILDLIVRVPCTHLPSLVSTCHHCQILGDPSSSHVGDGFVPDVVDSAISDPSSFASRSPRLTDAFNLRSIFMAEDPRGDEGLPFALFPEFLEDLKKGVVDVDEFGNLFVVAGLFKGNNSTLNFNLFPSERIDFTHPLGGII